MASDHSRAKPLPPHDRRRAIVEAVVPLILERGATVTSREMAEAARVSEGTIFSVFPDKSAILLEAVMVSMDPVPIQNALESIPPDEPMARQMDAAVGILIDRSERFGLLVGALHTSQPEGHGNNPGARQYVKDSNAAILDSLSEFFERHADCLRVAPRTAAVTLRGFVFANTHPMLAPDNKVEVDDIVDLVLNGITETTGGGCA